LAEKHLYLPNRATILDFVLPLRYASGSDGAAPGSDVSGYARIGLTQERINKEIRTVIWSNLALSLALMLAASLSGAYLIQRMTRQMRTFLEQVRTSEELKRTNKELESFSYSVSHDLRAPLRAIDGFSHALLEDYADKLDAQGKNYLDRVRTACERMSQLIDDLLALSRVIRQEMQRRNVDLAVIARTVVDQLAQAEPDRRVEFLAPGNIPVKGDPGLLRIALENLMGNSWKFTRKKSDARIQLGITDKDGQKVFFVRDNGAGFDMTYADKLFGAFQRLHEASDFPGTGIGLATVQRIVHRHGGRVWAEGAVNQGATFYFTLKEDL
jgi:light-regulated signal transduction histidine kinase (bacteriophytochrome)